ncbi:hypothetical protein EBZ37_04535 [bacterium]|nr:hypothetical protein [bacterium]
MKHLNRKSSILKSILGMSAIALMLGQAHAVTSGNNQDQSEQKGAQKSEEKKAEQKSDQKAEQKTEQKSEEQKNEQKGEQKASEVKTGSTNQKASQKGLKSLYRFQAERHHKGDQKGDDMKEKKFR